MKKKKTIFLTGATGTMGGAGLKEIAKRFDRFKVTLLARPSQANQTKLAVYKDCEDVRIVWGDLTRYEDVLKGLRGQTMCSMWVVWFRQLRIIIPRRHVVSIP